MEVESRLPPRIHHAYWFQAFNAVSWQICLGSPLILFARELGAPSVVLGLLAGLSPLTSVLQLAVAPRAEKIGYRTLMLRGWTARVVTLIFLTVLPLAALALPAGVIIALLVATMTAFTVLRGIAVCAWLPWITRIVPRSLRGHYLSRDRIFINLATVAALAVSGVFLFGHQNLSAYSIVFGIGFLGGAVSLAFLNRIPQPPAAPEPQPSAHAVSWLSLLKLPAFVRLLTFSAVAQAFILSGATFVTVFAREEVQLSDGTILWLTAGASVLGTLALGVLRNRVDRLGSRPFLGLVMMWWAVYFLLWFLMAARLVGGAQVIAPVMMVVAGCFGATYDLALTRLLMNTAGDRPATTRYFALHSVVVSLLAGVGPMVWGGLLDALRLAPIVLAGVALNRYAVLFGAQFLALGAVLLALARVKEPNSASTGDLLRRIFVEFPGRAVQQLARQLGRHAPANRRPG